MVRSRGEYLKAHCESAKRYRDKNKEKIKIKSKEYKKTYYSDPRNKEKNLTTTRKRNKHRIWFKCKRIVLGTVSRTGVCNWCRAVVGIDCKVTHLHHDENRYDSDNPVRFTIELCYHCHMKESKRLRKSKKLI